MDMTTLAEIIGTIPQELRAFFRSDPQWSAVDIHCLDDSSIPVIEQAFIKWGGALLVTVPPTEQQLKSKDGVLPLEYVQTEARKMSPKFRKEVRDLAAKQEDWLQQRLAKLGLSVPQQKRNSAWREYPKKEKGSYSV